MITLCLALVLQQDLPTDKDADEAVKKLKAALAEPYEDAQIAAIREAAKMRHDKVARAIGQVLGGGSEKARIAAALALGDLDHPASAEVLAAALPPNLKTPPVVAAIASALGKLQYESSVTALLDVTRHIGEPEARTAMTEVLAALGAIGSASAVDPLVDLLARLAGPRRDPWPETNQIVKATRDALQAITGQSAEKRSEFEDWWKANKATLVANARRTYWSKKTHERSEVGPGEKTPADSVFVHARMVDPAPASDPDKKKRKKK